MYQFEEEPQQKFFIPQKNDVIKLIADLKNADLSNISVPKLLWTFQKSLGVIPIVKRKNLKDKKVIRIRINSGEQLFYSEKELSYRPDVYNINTFGRASVPKQAVFYGTLVFDGLTNALMTALSEINQIFRNSDKDEPHDFFCTLSFWNISENLQTSEILFAKKFIETIQYIRNSHQEYIEWISQEFPQNKVEVTLMILEYIANEFSKEKVERNSDYLISASYSQLLFDVFKNEAILYPSAVVDNGGINIAIQPIAVELKLKLIGALFCKVEMKNKKRILYGLKQTQDFGSFNSKFNWSEINHNPIDIELIKNWLNFKY